MLQELTRVDSEYAKRFKVSLLILLMDLILDISKRGREFQEKNPRRGLYILHEARVSRNSSWWATLAIASTEVLKCLQRRSPLISIPIFVIYTAGVQIFPKDIHAIETPGDRGEAGPLGKWSMNCIGMSVVTGQILFGRLVWLDSGSNRAQ